MPEFDPSQPFSVIDAAIAGSSLPANPSAIDLAVAPTVSTPAPAPEVAQVPEFDPTQPFTSVPAGPVQSAPAGPTFDPKAEFQKAFSIDDLKSKTVAELDAEKDFHPAEFNHQFEDALNADPIAKQKLLDVYKLRESTGRTTKDQLKEAAASPGKAVVGVGKSVGGAIGGLVSGAAKVFQNVSESGVGGAFRLLGAASVGGRAGQLGMNEEAKQIQGRQAELVAGVETAAVGTSDLLRRGVRTALEFAAATEGPDGFVQSLSGVKPTADLTNEEWAGRLLNDVASKKALSEATRGAGETMKEIGLRSEELKAAGIEIRPEVVEAMSPALDITNLLPLGAGAKVGVMTKAGGRYAVRELATATTKTQASKFIAAMNAGVEATPGVLGKGTAAVGKGIESAGVGAAKVTKFLGDAGNVAGVGALAYGSGGVGAGILAVTKAGPLALRATGRAIQAVAPAVAPAIRVGADIGAEFVKGYGQGLLFTAPFMIGADAEEREGLLGAAGLGGVARGGIRALGYGKHVARLAAEADQETLAGIIFKEVNQSTPPETKPYGTDPRLDADSARQIAKLDADPVRARAARVAHIEKAFDAETARMDVEDPLTPRQLEKRARLREEKLAKIPEVVKVQQNLLGWAKNLFKDSGVEFYAVDDAGMMRQTGGQSGRGFTVKTTTANGNPVVRVFLNGDVESLPHEMLHALGEIDAPGYTEFRNEVNATLTPDQKKSFEQIYNTVHNGGLPEAQWKNRLTPEQVSNEIAAELFSRTVLGEDLSGVAPSLTKRAALFTAGLLEKLGVPLGKLTKAQAKDFVPKGTKIKAGFSTLGLRPGVEAQALGQNFIRGLLKRAAEDAALPTGKAAGKGGTPPSPGGPGAAPISPRGIPPAPAPATPGATTPAVPPAVNPPSGPRNIRVTRERQDAFGIPEAQATAAALGNPDVLARVNEISEVIGTDTPALEILYKSVKDDGSPGDPTPRNPRRSAQEEERAAKAVGEIPENARELVQKIIVPVRWVTVGKGTLKSPFKPELIAMSLDKVAANVQMVVKEAQGKAGAEVPYGNKDGALTDAGWTDVIADLKTYAKNQRNGWKGDGGKLVRAEKSAGMDIPDETPGFTPTRIEDPNRANFLNMVQGFKLPFTNIRRSAEIPANLKGQKLAEINFRKVEPPVKAAIRKKDILKQTYPAQVTEPIFPGRGPMDIGEPNPMRNQFWDAGVDVGKLIEGVERISPEQVATVTPRPTIDYVAPVTDTIRGGFLPGEAEGAGTKFIKRQNIDDLGRNILDSTQEKWQETTIEAGGLTGAAYKVGHRLEKAGDVAKLRAFEAEAKKQYDGAIAVQDFDAAMLAATKKQFFTEALETATGMKPGKRETIARYLGPDWKPPFPEEAAPKGQLLPKTDNPEAVKSAAIRNAETGDIFSGSTHGEAMRKADEKAGAPHSLSIAYTNPNYEQGFVTQGGDFLNRSEAMKRVAEIGQISPENLADASQLGKGEKLESVGFQSSRNFLPGEQTDAALRSGLLPDPKPVKNQPDSAIRELAGKLAIAAGVDYKPAEVYAPLDPGLSNRLADFYDTAKSDPKNPEVVTSYAALADETMKQYRALTAAGYKFEPFTGEGEPYKNSAEAVADIRDNKHLFVLSTALNFEGGNDNPMLLSSGVEGLPTVNDVFRGVHDVFGHAKEGYQFGPRGEFNAWRAHSEMYSPEAQGALAAETLAQNSWVNFGPHLRGDAEIPPSERPFAEQKAVVVPQELIDEARGQLLPKPKRDERGRPLTKDGLVDYEKLYKEKTAEEKRQAAAEAKTPSKYSTPTKASARGPKLTGWILPNRTFVPLDSSFHEQHLADNAENFNKQFGTAFSKTPNVEDRLVALNKGFVRIRGGLQGDRRTEGAGGVVIEMNEKFFPKARGTVESYLLDNAESIDNLTVNLLNDKGNVKDYQRVVVHELDGAERANALLSVLDDLRLRGPEGNFLPGGEETLPGLNLPSEERAKQLRVKSRVAKSRDKFPEALKLAYAKDDAGKFILGDDGKPKPRVSEYVFMDTPLAREAAKGLKGEDRVTAVAEALGKRLVIEGRDALKNPEMSAGTKWYSTARTRLKGLFGDDSKFFAELLGATSARTPVEVNYRFALDAYNQFKLGKFDGIIKKYREGKLRWLNADVKDFLKANPGNTDPTRGQFLDWWVIEHDLGPTQVNGKKYGANSRQVLRVLDGSWAAETGGPKTPNFAGNLSGSTFAATVDVWAARALHRLANEGNEKPWRILPEMETGVTDEDFAIGQAAYKFAADKLGMKPDALQAVLWFAEKDRWEREGWTRGAGAAKSDFNVLLKETEKVMPGGTFRMKNPQKELAIDVKPGDLVIRKKR